MTETEPARPIDGDLAGRTALITGAGSGMGAATARMFARHGARVIVADVDEAGGQDTVAAIDTAGGEARFVRTDVSVEQDVIAAISAATEWTGRLDCAVNNAAVRPDAAPLVDLDIDVFDRIIAVNLRAVALCLKHQLRQLGQQGGPAAIVNVGSVSSVRARESNAAYVAAKHGVIGLTKVAALEHGRDGIRVNAILPGGIDTPMIRESRAARGDDVVSDDFALSLFGRLGTPDEIAEANLWLCSDRSSYVTGHSLAGRLRLSCAVTQAPSLPVGRLRGRSVSRASSTPGNRYPAAPRLLDPCHHVPVGRGGTDR